MTKPIAKFKLKDISKIYTVALKIGYCITESIAEEIWEHYSEIHNKVWLPIKEDEEIERAIRLYFIKEI